MVRILLDILHFNVLTIAGICFLGGVDYGGCCNDGICAGSRCRDPKTLTSAQPTAIPQPTCVPYDGMHPTEQRYLDGL